MRVAVLGYGVEGTSAVRYWQSLGADITVCDEKTEIELPEGVDSILGPTWLDDLAGFDLVVRTPSIRPDRIHTDGKVTSVVREFIAKCPAPIIGVTGTKGKGTTSSLIAEILKSAGKTVWIGGNIGRAPLDFLADVKPDHYVVLELSSYQTMDMDQSPEVAVCLMMAPEHLNWHVDMDEYVEAKSQLFAHQKANDLAIYKAGDSISAGIAAHSVGLKRAYSTAHHPELDSGSVLGAHLDGNQIKIDETIICATSEVGLLGPHNLENICAAVTATWDIVNHDPGPIRTAIMAFTGLEHRLELAGEVDGVKYYDDSFATTPETAIAAIRSFTQPKVIILGGSDKKSVYADLAQVVENEGVIHAIVIGEVASQIAASLRSVGFDHLTLGLTNMREIVETCYKITEPGDVVLLSPGCASFGLFKDYKDRGNQFQAAVHTLIERSRAAQ